jgi:K+-transporting ATPase ATPase C chain
MKNLALSTFLYIFCFIAITVYTLLIYVIGQNFWPEKAKGSLILDEKNNIRGSYLIAQHLKEAKYFKARPKIEFDPECDIAIYNTSFKKALILNYDKRISHYDVTMMTTSSSRLDPFITRKEAMSQALNISKVRGIDVKDLYQIIDQHTLYKQKLFFELDIINTSILNAILDGYSKSG